MNNSTTYNLLYNSLNKLDITQFKALYRILTYYWTHYKYFISEQNFLALWCNLNTHCRHLDKDFPAPKRGSKKLTKFCIEHPYYFIDRLPLSLVAKLFSNYLDDRIEIFIGLANTLRKSNILSAYSYANTALGLNDPINELAIQAEESIKSYS